MVPASDRAVSEVVGAIFVFAFLMIGFTIYQGMIIPDQNKDIEFNHNENVHDSVKDLRNAIRQAATTGNERSVSISLGVDYPDRAIAINPGRSTGSLSTQSLSAATIRNVSASDSEVDEYVSNSRLGSFETKALVYTPGYVYYSNAPESRYENGIAYNHFPNGANITLTGQDLVDGTTIRLITLTGNLSKAQTGSVSVDPTALSAATNTVSITNTSDSRVNITIPTRLPASKWRELFNETNEENVHAVRPTGDHKVSIILKQGPTYELELAKIGVGTGATDPGAEYIIDEDGDGATIAEGGNQLLVVEVRDRFNNPVNNVSVDWNWKNQIGGSGEGVSQSDDRTDIDGLARFTYNAPDNVDETRYAEVEITFGDGTDANETVAFNVSVFDSDGSGGGSGSGTYNAQWENPNTTGDNSGEDLSNCGADSCTFETSSSGTLTLRMNTSPALKGVSVDYSVDNSTVGTLDQSEGETDSSGENTTTLTAENNGTVGVYVTTDGGTDRIDITVEIVDPGPEGQLAYDDANNNGQYDDSETTYTESELTGGFEKDVNLVIPSDVGGGTISKSGGFEIKAENITSRVNYESDGKVKLKAEKGDSGFVDINGRKILAGDIELKGKEIFAQNANLTSNVSDKAVTIKGDQGSPYRVNVTGIFIDSGNDLEIRGGDLIMNDSDITAADKLHLIADSADPERIMADGATMTLESGGSDFEIGKDGSAKNISIRNANLESNGVNINILADDGRGPIDAAGVNISSSGGDISLKTSNDTIDISDSSTQEAIIDAGSGAASADLGDGATLFYEGVVIRDSDDTLQANNAQDSGDTTESGSVSFS